MVVHPSPTGLALAVSSALLVVSIPMAAQSGPLEDERAFESKIKSERTTRGLRALTWDDQLAATARAHSAQMASSGTLYHNPALIADVGRTHPNWESAGENVGGGGSVADIHRAFMDSAPHRANILGNYNKLGVGEVLDADGTLWVTQMFVRDTSVTAAQSSPPQDVVYSDNAFAPTSLAVRVTTEVDWRRAPGSLNQHNVREDHGVFRSGAPSNQPFQMVRVFSAGTFRYYCEVHGSITGGMRGQIRVPVSISSTPSGAPFTVRWAAYGTTTGTRWDVQYRIGDGSWRSWKSTTSAFSAVFGAKDSPKRVRSGTTYGIRARSRNGNAASDWSPPKTYRP